MKSLVAERNDLLYVVTVRHGPFASEKTLRELDWIVMNFRFRDGD